MKPVKVGAMALMFALGMVLAVFVAGSAAAKSPKTTTTKKSSSKPKTTSTLPSYTDTTTTTSSPGDSFFVVNGTVNAASDHEIVGSSAFPNFTTGAVDNYYSMAHSHVDNSPFAEGTASPADTGPVGQTAAAGQFQQPQYADARWPGDTGKATYGTKGQPYAEAAADEYQATANASEAENGLSGPGLGGKKTLALPAGFDLRLRQALAGWKSKWQAPLGLAKPALPASPVKRPTAPVKRPRVPVKAPTATVTTPIATVTTPNAVSGVNAPPVQVPSTAVPPPPPTPTITLPSAGATGASRSLASLKTSQSTSTAAPADGESLLKSSTQANLVREADKPCKKNTTTTDATTAASATATATATATTKSKATKPKAAKADTTKTATCKTYALVTSGESSLGRVSLGGGQIVIEGIHVNASISNDGTPTYKANVSIASATIGGVPVTIDQDGVHVAGQGQGLPYQQASDALNGALKQAGIQLFLVGPEVKNGCGDQMGTGTGGGTTTTSSDQSGASSSCDQSGASSSSSSCDQSGSGSTPSLPTPTPPSGDQSGTTSSCDQTGAMCDQAGSGTGGGTGSTSTTTTSSSCDQSGAMCDQSGTATGGGSGAGGIPGIGTTTSTTTTTTTSSKDQSGTTTTTSSCGATGLPSTTGSCSSTGTASGTSTTSNDQAGTSTTMGSGDQFGLGGNSSNAAEETVTATGLHVVFTQPVNQSGVPSQFVEHILGEVYVDSLAVPASDSPGLGFSSASSSGSFSSPSGCGGNLGGATSGASAGGSSSGGGGTAASGVGSAAGSTFGSSSQPGSSSTGSSLPAAFAAALRKPLWLLLAYVLWQAIVIATGASLWNWRRDGAS